MKEYSAYLFDGDGTLYDTADMIFRCFQHTCRKFRGIEIERDAIYKSIGLPYRPQLEMLVGKLSDKEFDEMTDSHRAYQQTIYKDSVKLFPHIKTVLEELKKRDKKLAVVTSRKIPSLVRYLKYTDIESYFDCLITPESTTKHKPEPEPAIEAMRQLGATSKETLFVGDARFDIECGRAAGTDTAYVNWSFAGNHPDDVQADYYIDNIQELLNWTKN